MQGSQLHMEIPILHNKYFRVAMKHDYLHIKVLLYPFLWESYLTFDFLIISRTETLNSD